MNVITTDKFDLATALELIEQRAQILRVENFYPATACARVCEIVQSSKHYGRYENAPSIARLGRAFFEKQASAAAREDYELNSVNWIADIRAALAPILSPIDKLRLELDEIWPAGATLATLEGARAFCGLYRVFPPGAIAEPHMDVLAWDLPANSPEGELKLQFAANVYLQVPQSGGELLVWPISLDREKYSELNTGSYGVDASRLGVQPTIITPKVGELILFNCRLVHAVNDNDECDRVAASCFVGYRGGSAPLPVWS